MSLRASLSLDLMKTLCWLEARNPTAPAHPGFYRSRIWSGPLRGMRLTVPRLERPALFLGTYEPHMVKAMRRYVSRGAVVYDIGAHVGYLTAVLAKLVGPSGRVIACEPDPLNRAALEQNMAKNALSHVTILSAAISDTAGEASFAHFDSYSLVGHLSRADTPPDATLVRVPTLTLDDLLSFSIPAFIKIDVEGAEMAVLAGGKRLLRTVRPVIVAEVRYAFRVELAALLDTYRYHLEMLRGGEEDWRRWGLAEVLLVPQR